MAALSTWQERQTDKQPRNLQRRPYTQWLQLSLALRPMHPYSPGMPSLHTRSVHSRSFISPNMQPLTFLCRTPFVAQNA